MSRFTKEPRPMSVYASVIILTEAVMLSKNSNLLAFLKFKTNDAILCPGSHSTEAYSGLCLGFELTEAVKPIRFKNPKSQHCSCVLFIRKKRAVAGSKNPGRATTDFAPPSRWLHDCPLHLWEETPWALRNPSAAKPSEGFTGRVRGWGRPGIWYGAKSKRKASGGFNGLDHAHVEDGYRVEDEPLDLKSLGQVLAPGEEDVGDEDIGMRLFQDSFDLRLDEVRCHVDFCGGGAHGGWNQIFHSFR